MVKKQTNAEKEEKPKKRLGKRKKAVKPTETKKEPQIKIDKKVVKESKKPKKQYKELENELDKINKPKPDKKDEDKPKGDLLTLNELKNKIDVPNWQIVKTLVIHGKQREMDIEDSKHPKNQKPFMSEQELKELINKNVGG